jgi:hypothetical protein
MADDSERLKRVTDRVRKHLTGMMLKPKDMTDADKATADVAQGKEDILAEGKGGSDTRRVGDKEQQEPQEAAAADLAPAGADERQDEVRSNNDVHINPISKSKHFRSIVDAYRKTK